MIKALLEYQTAEKKKLELMYSLESGKLRRELAEAEKALDATKRHVLELDIDAKSLMATLEAVKKNMGELVSRTEEIQKKPYETMTEDELNSALAYANQVAAKVAAYESQLGDLTRKINDRATKFEDAKKKIITATKTIQTLQPQLDTKRAELKPQMDEFDKQLTALAKNVEPKLLERYKKKRAMDKGQKPVDIIVQVLGERCGGCMFEMPLSQIHKIGVDGYIVCEECNKILYK